MLKQADNNPQVLPSVTPSEAEVTAWQTLPRDVQLHRLQAKLTHPDCMAISTATLRDVLDRAQAAAQLRNG